MFIDILKSIFLGIIQGFTEFLPVSSSGHLFLFQQILGMEDNMMFTAVMLHFGTLVAVCVYYFRDLLHLFTREGCNALWLLIIATIPAGITGLLLNDKMEEWFSDGKLLCFFFLFTAILLFVTELIAKKQKNEHPLSGKTAVAMGLAQATLGLFPGISRSGSTICAGILCKTERNSVAKFSFFMSIPVILGSTLLELFQVDFSTVNLVATLFGTFAAGLSGYFAIDWMVKLIGKSNFKWFSLYLLALSIITFINAFVVHIW